MVFDDICWQVITLGWQRLGLLAVWVLIESGLRWKRIHAPCLRLLLCVIATVDESLDYYCDYNAIYHRRHHHYCRCYTVLYRAGPPLVHYCVLCNDIHTLRPHRQLDREGAVVVLATAASTSALPDFVTPLCLGKQRRTRTKPLWRRRQRPSVRGATPLPRSNPEYRSELYSIWRRARTGSQRAVALLMPEGSTATRIHTPKLCDLHLGWERGILCACCPTANTSHTNKYRLYPPTASMLSHWTGHRARYHGGTASGGDAAWGEYPSLAQYVWR